VQVNRLAGLAVMLHCILPSALGLPPLQTPSVKPRAHRAAFVLGACMLACYAIGGLRFYMGCLHAQHLRH